MPSDERWIAPDHEASNEKLIRDHLIQGEAASASVLGFKLDYETPFEAEAALNKQLEEHLENCAVAIVGMGLDGHFASLFPGTAQLAEAMNPDNQALCAGVDATGCPVAGNYTQRMTLTLSAILRARRVVLLFKGQDKIDLVKQVIADEPEARDLPVYQLLHQAGTPVDICCA
jgi:6-phosphogluconolactonase